MKGNIVGEEFESYVFNQIARRQADQYSGYDSKRTPEQLQYLNNKTAWVKLASGMQFIVEEDSGFDGFTRLQEILGDDEILSQLKGTNLAEKTILFNGTSFLNRAVENESYDNEGNPEFGGDNFQRVGKGLGYTSRSGYSKNQSIWNFSKVYGLGGPDFGQQPMPGITSMTTKSLNRGSIKEANIQIKCYNKFQFAILELLYLRIGFTMMLEWGNDKYISNSGAFKETGNTIIEDVWFTQDCYNQLTMLSTIEEYREKYEGNYDGFFGKVVNFTWTFNADGSYDIDLKLVTVGDVVESFSANSPINDFDIKSIKSTIEDKVDKNLLESPLVKASQNNIIGKYLFQTIYENDNKELWDGDNYFDFLDAATKSGQGNAKQKGIDSFAKTVKAQLQYSYFIRLGELLKVFENNVIPGIEQCGDKISSMLSIERSDDGNIISYYPNQISLDPRICVFKYVLGDLGDADGFGLKGINQPSYLNSLRTYVDVNDEGVIYGKLMNLYINYDFVSKCLNSSGSDGKVTIFKFFQKLCDGINVALGGVNNLEPILKDDKVITIIDQNPIPGFLEVGENKATDIVDLEVYGYNSAKKQSNFVKDISFKTQITPDLASMISIGTTAGGSSTKEDGTAFSYWNQGLRDRFAPKIVDPTEKQTGPKTQSQKEKEAKEKRIKGYIEWFDENSTWALPDYDFQGFRSVGIGLPTPVVTNNSYDPIPSPYYKDSYYKNKRRHITSETAIKYRDVSIRQYIEKQEEEFEYLQANKNIVTSNDLVNLKQENYAFYLIQAFGGQSDIKIRKSVPKSEGFLVKYVVEEVKLDPIPPKNAVYPFFDEEVIKRGKASYKAYISTIKQIAYDREKNQDQRSPSNTIGFIPVGFNLTLEGISGIKIYNKLNINNTFLPQNYPKALKFLIQKVDHKIQDNTWETDLDTLSIPNVKPSKMSPEDRKELITRIKENSGGELLPVIRRGPHPLPPGKSTATWVYYKGKGYSGNAKTKIPEFLNIDAREPFSKFLGEFVSEWDGYVMNINAIGRSIEKSIELQKEDSRNADPGRSKHNYYAAIDLNITTPDGSVLRKAERISWINHGIDKLASKHGLIWGGNFSNYTDSVHFEYPFSIETAVENAITKYGSLESMRGDDGKNVKLT